MDDPFDNRVHYDNVSMEYALLFMMAMVLLYWGQRGIEANKEEYIVMYVMGYLEMEKKVAEIRKENEKLIKKLKELM